MFKVLRSAAFTTAVALALAAAPSAAQEVTNNQDPGGDHHQSIQLGTRPYYLVDGMDASPLKNKLMQCKNGPFRRTDFSIGHRGAAGQFPEHTKEAYEAGARMGAGIVECDVTFTKNGDLVCRHSDADLHFTTNILQTPLADTCRAPFTPATLDSGGNVIKPASADCRTWALSLDEFKTLQGKMEGLNPAAQTVDQFVLGTPAWRTDLYTGRGTVMSMRDSIRLNKNNGVKQTPELKGPDASGGDAANKQAIIDIFGSQEAYAQRFADVLDDENVDPRDAFPQSFNVNDILYWINHTRYGRQAVFLVDYDDVTNNILLFDTQGHQLVTRQEQLAFFAQLKNARVKIIAPAMPALLQVTPAGKIVPSQLANDLKGMGFDLITWTFERSDLRRGASQAGFYYDFDPTGVAIKKDSDMYKALDVLARDVKIIGIFSDWAATVTYYANCMNLD